MPEIQIIPSDFRLMLKNIKDKSVDLAIADWPFYEGNIDDPTIIKMFHDGTKEASRILKDNGNFVSVHFPHCNFEVGIKAKEHNLTVRDQIMIEKAVMVKSKNHLARAHMSIWVFSKTTDRILNERNSFVGRFFDSKVMDIVTDVWSGDGNKKFKNGWWNKASGDKVSEAMPQRVVKQVLDLYSKSDSVVVDYFGGSGNFPIECLNRGLNCVASELNSDHYDIINKRLLNLATKCIDGAIEQSDTTTGGKRWEKVRAEQRSQQQPKLIPALQLQETSSASLKNTNIS